MLRSTFVFALALGLVACATTRSSYVASSTQRGGFIDASFVAASGEWRFLFPATQECRSILAPEAPITYSPGGMWGRFRSPGDVVCDPAGVGNLHRWRRSRVEGEMAPSSAARWEIEYQDDEVFLLRGRFAVATRVGFAGTHDIVAMVANDDVCRPVAESGNATLVFRPSGSRAFTLGRCEVLAFARPVS